MTKRLKKFGLAIAALTLAFSGSATSALAANINVSPDIDFQLPADYYFSRGAFTVLPDGSYWICAYDVDSNTVALKFAANASGSDSPIQVLDLTGRNCFSLAVDTSGNLFVGMDDRIQIFSGDASGSAAPIREITTEGLSVNGLTLDYDNNIYVLNSDGDIWIYQAGSAGNGAADRIIDGSSLGGDDKYLAAGADGTVYVADYADEAIHIFAPNNNGPSFDRTITYDDSNYASFGGITLNGSNLFVTFQDGSAPGIYEFPANADGLTAPTNSWSGSNVVVSGDDALYGVSVGGCSGQLISLEGYNNRVLTWDLADTECPAAANNNSSDDKSLAETGSKFEGSLPLAASIVVLGAFAVFISRKTVKKN